MNLNEVITIAQAAGFRGLGLVRSVAIAIAESSLNQNAVGDISLQTEKWGPSVGLWQIRTLKPAYLHLEPVRDYTKLFNPLENAKAAYQISKGGTDFSAWSTYVNNSYAKYIANVEKAIPAAGGLLLIAGILYLLFS